MLVTGPTGSGKSTTLASLIDIVNRERSVHIMTVEDPIEFLHKHKRSLINQREVGEDTHSFAAALKHVLRQDPDVILVGEMRDLETISTALTAAETGHLVFATLHTQDAPQSIDRVIDVFPAHQQQQVRVQLAVGAAGDLHAAAHPDARRSGPRRSRARCMVATPAVRNLIREGKIHQIYSMLQAGGQVRHGHDGHVARAARAVRARSRSRWRSNGARNEEDLRRLLNGLTDRCPRPSRTRSATSAGKLVEGQLEAENAQLVVSKLRSMGYVPIEIEQQGGKTLSKDLKIPGFSDRVKLKDVAVFSRQFATMINSGLSMLRSLYILAEQTESKALAEVVNQVRIDVEKGASLSAALAKHPKAFNRLYVAMVQRR